VTCPPYTIQAGNACIFPCSMQPCAACTTGFVQCVGNPDGSHICASNLAFEPDSGDCPEAGCSTSGASCYSNATGNFDCFRVISSRICTTTEALTTTTTREPTTTTTTALPCQAAAECVDFVPGSEAACWLCYQGSCLPAEFGSLGDCLDCEACDGNLTCVPDPRQNVDPCGVDGICCHGICLEGRECCVTTGCGECRTCSAGICVPLCPGCLECDSAAGQCVPNDALCGGCFECDGLTAQCLPNNANCTATGECRDAFCLEGSCLYVPNNANCDDGNDCTAGVCSINGICSHSTLPDGTSCLDGKGHCVAGTCACACVSGGECYAQGAPNPENGCQTCNLAFGWVPILCNPFIPCQDLTGCDNGCRYVPADEGAPCDVIQANPCQVATGTCTNGSCVASFEDLPDGAACALCGADPVCGTCQCQEGACVPVGGDSTNGQACGLFPSSCGADPACGVCQCLSGACVAVETGNSDGDNCGLLIDICTDQICQSGACVTEPVNNGAFCGTQPLDTCRVSVCRDGRCTETYVGPDGATCTSPEARSCETGSCHGDTEECDFFGPRTCPNSGICRLVLCNPETNACDIFIPHESGTQPCDSFEECCPDQVCAPDCCSVFCTESHCYDPDNVPVCP
jgi:hypothetical protein